MAKKAAVTCAAMLALLDKLTDEQVLTSRELAEKLGTTCQRLRDIFALHGAALDAYRFVIRARQSFYGNKQAIAALKQDKHQQRAKAPVSHADRLLSLLQQAPNDEVYSAEELSKMLQMSVDHVRQCIRGNKPAFAPHTLKTPNAHFYGSCAALERVLTEVSK